MVVIGSYWSKKKPIMAQFLGKDAFLFWMKNVLFMKKHNRLLDLINLSVEIKNTTSQNKCFDINVVKSSSIKRQNAS